MTPKAKIKKEKKDKVEDLKNAFENSRSAVFVDYKGMDVPTIQEFRARVKEAGGNVRVSKNTLIKLAAKNAGLPDTILSRDILSGQTAVIFGQQDAVSPIQTLGKFIDERQLPQVRAAIVEGVFQDKDGVLKISKLPTREELQAQVVGGLMSPLYGLVYLLKGNLQSLVMTLDSIKQQKQAQGG